MTDEEFFFLPINEYDSFVKDWQEEDRIAAYRNAELIATIMNQNPYRKRPVTAKQLLGETESKPGDGLADIRFLLDGLAASKKMKEAGNG